MSGDTYDALGPAGALSRQLDRIEYLALEAKEAAKVASVSANATNGRVTVIEQVLGGPTDRTGRHMGGGLLQQVEMLQEKISRVEAWTTSMSAAKRESVDLRALGFAALGILLTGGMLAAAVLGLIL